MYKITYSIEQLHRCDWTYENRSQTSKTSFNEDQVRTQETYEHKTQGLYRCVSVQVEELVPRGKYLHAGVCVCVPPQP